MYSPHAKLKGKENDFDRRFSQTGTTARRVGLSSSVGRISFIRDYKYVRYVIDDAELVFAPDTAPPGERMAG